MLSSFYLKSPKSRICIQSAMLQDLRARVSLRLFDPRPWRIKCFLPSTTQIWATSECTRIVFKFAGWAETKLRHSLKFLLASLRSFKTAHPKLVSLCTSESLSNLCCGPYISQTTETFLLSEPSSSSKQSRAECFCSVILKILSRWKMILPHKLPH